MNRITDDILFKVDKPSRYTGGEYNMKVKDPESVDIRFVHAFPDVYEVGMSHLGSRILYNTMNMRSDTYCERVYNPYPDMEKLMRENDITLTSIETGTPVKEFDILGFALLYEMSYTNLLNILDLSGIPLDSDSRSNDDPIVMAGGPCAVNPEPLHRFIDFFEIGEGEYMMDDVLSLYAEHKKKGFDRKAFLEDVARIEGIYVPSLYEVSYKEDGTIKEMVRKSEKAPEKVVKRIVPVLDEVAYPTDLIVPFCEPTHDRIMMETFRGCTRGCRFCMAGMIYRPVREKTTDKIMELTDIIMKETGYEEISLTSLSTCDHSNIQMLVENLVKKYADQKVSISLPSIRVDAFSVGLINEIQKIRKTGLTFAPEAGTQRMRDIINKNVTEEDILSATRHAFELGWSTIKLYTMIGLPYETLEDAKGIALLAERISKEYFRVPKENRNKNLKINLSTSIFIPKPFTPFQWVPQDKTENILEKVYEIKHNLKNRSIEFSWHESDLSLLEAIVSRGDRRVADLILAAFKNGAKMDGWTEYFNYPAWVKAMEETGIDPNFYAYRQREYDEILPWDFIDIGVRKDYLIEENEKAKTANVTRDCREGCLDCGVMDVYGREACFNGIILN